MAFIMELFKSTPMPCDETVKFEEHEKEDNSNTFNLMPNKPIPAENTTKANTFDALHKRLIEARKIHSKFLNKRERMMKENILRSTTVVSGAVHEDNKQCETINETDDKKINPNTTNDILRQPTTDSCENMRHILVEVNRFSKSILSFVISL